MVKLFCVVVGEQGNAFPVDIAASESVGDLKNAIKGEKPATITCDVRELKLFLAKKGDTWMTQKQVEEGISNTTDFKPLMVVAAPLQTVGLSEKDVAFELTKEDIETRNSPVHVLMVVPRTKSQVVGGKRVREHEWFVVERFSVQKKKRKLDEPDQYTRYFMMTDFPPLAHPMQKYPKILERDAYVVIFRELMGKMKLSFDVKSGANLVVTGNPGTGISRFYLYCIFRLLLEHQENAEELASFDLVLNSRGIFHIYDAKSKEFVELDTDEVYELSQQRNVLRLIEGASVQLTGWSGVSILFASPGLKGMNSYTKVDSFTYILPVWSLDELQDYNSLLDDRYKLAEDVLMLRYDKFGGIPRFIFTVSERENDFKLSQAIATFAFDIIPYAQNNHAVKDEIYSLLILEMVPDRVDFQRKFHFEFLSNYIAERIVAKVEKDSLQRVSKFAITYANDDLGRTAVVRDKIYEMLAHKWFNLHKQECVQLRSLGSKECVDLIVPENMPMVRFSTLDEIRIVPPRMIYYQPTSKTFGAFDAFILDGKNTRCYGLQMTLNMDHEIEAAPLRSFLLWLEGIDIPTDQLYFCFVVPSNIAPQFPKQTIRTKTDEVDKRGGTLESVKQYVVALDAFVENK